MSSWYLPAGDLIIWEPGPVSALLLLRARHHGVHLAGEVQVGEVREGGVRVGQEAPRHVGVGPAATAT